TYTDQVVASGEFFVPGASRTFTNALVTLTLVGDTENVKLDSLGLFINTSGLFTVNVSGIGTATFTDPTMEVFVNQVLNQFVRPAAGSADRDGLLLDPLNSAFSTYNLTTAIGPISGASEIDPLSGFGTTLGTLVLSSAGNSTFQAVTVPTVPEPSTLLLLG